jgi:hypothetical protein
MFTIPTGICCFCADTYTWCGNNAQPIVDKQCCDVCNYKYVIPSRVENKTPEQLRNILLQILADAEYDEEDSDDDSGCETPTSVLDTPFN